MKPKRSLWRATISASVPLAAVLLFAGSLRAAPIPGPYKSDDLGGLIQQGRYAESYAGGGQLQVGDVVNVASWDGTSLEEQWLISGPVIESITDMGVLPGDGVHLYVVRYDANDATMLMKDTGPWWDPGDSPGMTEYVVDITEYRHDVTIDPLGGVTSLVTLRGIFPEFTVGLDVYKVEVFLATAVREGEGLHPGAGYPEYLPPGYTGEGHWGVVQQIQTLVTYELIPEPATLGLLGLGAVGILTRRRRRA